MRYFLLAGIFFLSVVPGTVRAQPYGDPNALVDHWYRTFLGRAPDPGSTTWVNDLNQGLPPDQVLSTVLGGDEYYQRAGSTPQGYVTRLYGDLLSRTPSPSELDFWARRMYTEDRQAVALEILDQNPGEWVGSSPPVSTPVPVTPAVVVPGVDWHRDWHRDWDRRHDIHEYRRPEIHSHAPPARARRR